MKLSAILEDENTVMVPLYWLKREDRQTLIQGGYEVIPIPGYNEITITGYREADRFRAFKIIGKYTEKVWCIRNLSIPIWEDWKLTAEYASDIEIDNSTNGIQMFDHLDDDEKIRALKIFWYPATTEYIIKYFRDHPELLKRARHSLKREEIHNDFEDLL